MLNGFEAIAGRLSQQFARRPDVGDVGKLPQYRVQPLFHIFRNAVEQKGRGPQPPRPRLPYPPQGAVEQNWGDGRVLSHANWYAAASMPGNPAPQNRV